VGTCAQSFACTAYNDCLAACSTSAASCFTNCANSYPAGRQEFDQMSQCYQDKCLTSACTT
jgi:hypothetical protein